MQPSSASASAVAAATAALQTLSPRKRSAASMRDETTPAAAFSFSPSASHRPHLQVLRAPLTDTRQTGASDAAASPSSLGFAAGASPSASGRAEFASGGAACSSGVGPRIGLPASSRSFAAAPSRIAQLSEAPSKRRRASSASAGRRAHTAVPAPPRLTTHGSKRKEPASIASDGSADDGDDPVEQRGGIEGAALEPFPQSNGHRWVSEAYGKKRSKIDGDQATTTAAVSVVRSQRPSRRDREPDEHREAENEPPSAAAAVAAVQVASSSSADASADESMMSALSISSRSSSPTIASSTYSVLVSTDSEEREDPLQRPVCPLRGGGECCPTVDLLRRQNQHLRFMLQEEKGLRQKAEQQLAQMQTQQRSAGRSTAATASSSSFVSGPLSAQHLYSTVIGHSSSDESDTLSPVAAGASSSSMIPSCGSFWPSSAAFSWMLRGIHGQHPQQQLCIPYTFPNGLLGGSRGPL